MKPKKVGKPKIEGIKIQAKIDEKQLEFAKKNNEGKSSAEIVRMGIEALNNGFEKNIDVLIINDNLDLLEMLCLGYHFEEIPSTYIKLYNNKFKDSLETDEEDIGCESITQIKGDKFIIKLEKKGYITVEETLRNDIFKLFSGENTNRDNIDNTLKYYMKYQRNKMQKIFGCYSEIEQLELEIDPKYKNYYDNCRNLSTWVKQKKELEIMEKRNLIDRSNSLQEREKMRLRDEEIKNEIFENKEIKSLKAEIKRIYNTLPPVEYVIKSQSYSTIKL